MFSGDLKKMEKLKAADEGVPLVAFQVLVNVQKGTPLSKNHERVQNSLGKTFPTPCPLAKRLAVKVRLWQAGISQNTSFQ